MRQKKRFIFLGLGFFFLLLLLFLKFGPGFPAVFSVEFEPGVTLGAILVGGGGVLFLLAAIFWAFKRVAGALSERALLVTILVFLVLILVLDRLYRF